jgi:hypothetical protein
LSGEVALSPADPGALAAFVAAVSDPDSPDYQHYLTPGEFGSRFGASQDTIDATLKWLDERGLDGSVAGTDHLSVSFHATASRVETAFGVTLERYTVPGGATRFAPSTEPLVPSAIASQVEGVLGLTDTGVPRPLLATDGRSRAKTVAVRPGTGRSATRASISGPGACPAAADAASRNGAYTANRIASAYSIPAVYAQGRLGAGISVAVYELEPFAASDIRAYQSCYRTDATVSVTSVDGGPGTGFGTGESALDIEQVIGLAPDASVHVYQGPSFQNATDAEALDVYRKIADDDTSPVVSTSWGICEAGITSEFAHMESDVFAQMAAQGQSVFAASGDSGSEDCFVPNDPSSANLTVDDPGSQPFVTSAGGTTLTAVGPPPTEAVWNSCQGRSETTCADDQGYAFGAGGGGISSKWPMPSWQTGVINSYSSKKPCGATTDCREVPDVSASADPAHGYIIYVGGGWFPVGGTSASAPLWAAVTALSDQGCLVRGSSFAHSHVVGFANPKLYALGSSATPPFNDVTTGNNDFTDTNGGRYPATAHYDMATGWGTPVVSSLLPDLQPSGGCPSVTALSPTSGPTAGGTVVAISGSDLAGVTSVHFGTAAATNVSYNAGLQVVDATSPASARRGLVDVTVTTANGTSAADGFDKFDYVGPSVTALVPPAGTPDGGASIRITGGGFTGATAVHFGTAAAEHFAVSSDSEITATSPPGRNGEVVDVTVTTPVGTSPKFSQDHFTFTFDPVVTGVSPPSGTVRGGTQVTLTGANFGGTRVVEFAGVPAPFRVAGSNTIVATSPASRHGAQSAGITVVNAHGPSGPSGSAVFRYVVPPSGYWLAAADGGIFSYGAAGFHGSMGGKILNQPIVGISALSDDEGYRLVARDGGVFCFGASYHGSMGGRHLNAPIVGIAATADGGGYWLVASDGGIFSFGDAAFHGSMGGRHLNAPIVGIAASADDGGYWLVATDGGVFAFSAAFSGSAGDLRLVAQVVGASAT